MSQRSLKALLQDLILHGERVVDLVARLDRHSYLNDATTQDAVLWNLIVIGEVSRRLGEGFHAENPAIPWRTSSIFETCSRTAMTSLTTTWSTLSRYATSRLFSPKHAS